MVQHGDDLTNRLRDLLDPLPTADGGRAVIAALGSHPPALAMLATGSTLFAGGRLKLATESGSSFANAVPRHSATLLVADDVSVLRASIGPLTTEFFGHVAVVSGPLIAIRPSAELPWSLQLHFTPTGFAGRQPFLDYWASMRRWLVDDCRGPVPVHPRTE